jgi:hypothetical protein
MVKTTSDVLTVRSNREVQRTLTQNSSLFHVEAHDVIAADIFVHMFESNRQDVRGGWRKILNEEHRKCFPSSNIKGNVKEGEMGG